MGEQRHDVDLKKIIPFDTAFVDDGARLINLEILLLTLLFIQKN